MNARVASKAVSDEDKRLKYRLATTDGHAVIAASKGVNNAYISLHAVSKVPGTLSFTLSEPVVVELGSTDTGMGHDCSCSDYSAESPCSHVYWALDQLIRSEVFGRHREFDIRSLDGRLEIETPGGFIYNPMSLPEDLEARQVQIYAWNHTSPKVRFRDTMDKEKGRVAQILVRLSERSFPELDVGGPRMCTASSAHDALSNSAANLYSSYGTYRATLTNRNEVLDAIETVTSSFLSMMRAVVIRNESDGLRFTAARAYHHSADESCFWYHANAFVTSYGLEISYDDRVHLTNICNYMGYKASAYDRAVIDAMLEWPTIR